MKRKVTIQARGTTQSPSGQLSETWTDVYSTLGKVSYKSGNTSYNTRREVNVADFSITIPYSQKSLDITVENSVLVNGTRFGIEAIDSNSKWRKEVVLHCADFNGGV